MTTLADCRGKVESWVEREKRAADQLEEAYCQTLSQEQSAVESLEEELLAVQFKLGTKITEGPRHAGTSNPPVESIVQRRQNLIQESESLQAEIERLKQGRAEKERNVKGKAVVFPYSICMLVDYPDLTSLVFPYAELKKEEAQEQARAAEVRSKKQLAEESKDTTLDDLTRGIINYKYLGLAFEKGENNELWYDEFIALGCAGLKSKWDVGYDLTCMYTWFFFF